LIKTHIIIDTMDIPKKFEVNTDDFKIYFDNTRKTHVCENIETGEKTNIGVLGIFLQMGIIKPIEEKTDDRMKIISEKLSNLEVKLDEITKNINGIVVKPEEESYVKDEGVQEKPKSEIRERIMKKVLKQAEEETEEEPVEEEEPEESDVVKESEEEIENWNEI